MSQQAILNQQEFRDLIFTKDQEIEALTEQVNDLLIHFTTESAIQSSPNKEQFKEGTIKIKPRRKKR